MTDEARSARTKPLPPLPAAGTEAVEAVEADAVGVLGYQAELSRNRSMFTLLFQSLAIAAVW